MSRYPGNVITKSPVTPTGPNPLTGRAPGVWRMDEVAYWLKQGLWPDASADAYWPNVSLLLSTTSLSNANNNLFVDSSGAFNPISRNGNTTQGSFSPYGSVWSNYFDNTGDYLSIPANAAMSFGTGAFTLEAWVYNTTGWSTDPIFESRSSGGSSGGYAFLVNSSGYLDVYQSGAFLGTSTTALATNTWYHVALVRSGTGTNQTTYYINGVAAGTITLSANLTDGASNETKIGGSTTAGENWGGYISNARIVKGTAVYTSNFTPSTTPLTAISGTSLLTCQSNRFRDASSNNFTITVAGNTSVTDFSPFTLAAPGISYNQNDIQYWSGYLYDGSLSASLGASGQFGTGDFTVECWVNPMVGSVGSGDVIWTFGLYPANNGMFLSYSSNGTLNVYIGGATAISAASALTLSAWQHVAVARSGTTLRLFVNGAQVGSATNSTNLTDGFQYIGRPNDVASYYYRGYISNFRAVKGTAVYTAAFTPPTAPLTAISGTSLLTCQNAAFSDNSTNNFPITVVGNTTVTGNNPFQAGLYSGYFNGGSDRLQVPVTSNMYLGTTYTIEAWVYYTGSAAGARPIFSESETFQGGFTGLTLDIETDGKIYFSVRPTTGGAVTSIASSSTLPVNTWTHVAASVSAGSARLFINGTQNGSTTTFAEYPTAKTTFVAVGGWGNGWVDNGIPAGGWIGHLSNVRVVKGTALYTSNFTPSTTSLTAVSGTVLLTCQSNRFIDTSSVANTLTVNGSPSVQSFDPFYTASIASNGGSMYFDGSGDYLATQGLSDNYAFGNSDFTIEMWAYFNDVSTLQCFYDQRPSGTQGAYPALYVSSGTLRFNSNTTDLITATVTTGQWYHIAVSRSGSTTRMFVNGVSAGTYGTLINYLNGGAGRPGIGGGGFSTSTFFMNGYMNGVRVTKGTALYTAAFTPPTAPVTPTAATTLLVNGMNAGIYDATGINDMETVGNAQISTSVKKFGTGSMAFDGTGDWLFTPSKSELGYGTGDFTIEFWAYPNNSTGVQVILDQRAGSANRTAPTIYLNGGALRYYTDNADRITGGSVSSSQWSHIAVCRSGTSTRMFINGTQTGSTLTDSRSYLDSPLYLGEASDGIGGAAFNGYIDDLRITKGVARYTANFTPPTQAFPPY